MSTRKTIVVHGLIVAGILAVVGVLFAQLAGMWIASQSVPRSMAVESSTPTFAGQEVADALAWRLPLMMAVIGFVLVAIGEGLTSLWRQPVAPQPKQTVMENDMQRLLRELEQSEASTVPTSRSAEV